MVSIIQAVPFSLLLVFSFLYVTWAARGRLFGPRYNPVWGENDDTKFPNTYGPSSIRKLVEGTGLYYENYTVRTEDDYLLNLNRVVHPEKAGKSDKGYPILFLNGIFIQSEGWLLQHKLDSNIAPVWSALGYDVWIGDQRGTIRSTGHVYLNADRDTKYWDHGTYEIAAFDTSAFIDFILRKTGYDKVVIACVSFGCTMHAGLLDYRPEYNEKIRGAFYFNPLVNNIRKQLDMKFHYQMLMINFDLIVSSYEFKGLYRVSPRLPGVKKEIFQLCSPFKNFVIPIAKSLEGGNLHLSKEVCKQLASCIGGSSTKALKHVIQIYDRGEFAKYDYGREENLKIYGQDIPPLFNLTKITSFVALYYSDADGFTTVEGSKKFLKSLGGPKYECLMPEFHHIDVALGTTFKYIFPDVNAVLDSLTGYSNDTEKAKSGKCPSMEWVRGLK